MKSYSELASIFYTNSNYSSAQKYSKLAYEQSIRLLSPDKTIIYKVSYMKYLAAFKKIPPLRFKIGDIVECICMNTKEWKVGKIVELYYRENDFVPGFTAPYRVQLLYTPLTTPIPIPNNESDTTTTTPIATTNTILTPIPITTPITIHTSQILLILTQIVILILHLYILVSQILLLLTQIVILIRILYL